MKYLLDTHTLIWAFGDTEHLSDKARKLLQTETEIYVSIVSLWEIGIKKRLGKLDVPYSIKELAAQCEQENISIIPVLPEHIDKQATLPLIHKDPFDRMIIAQSELEEMTLITRDTIIPKYPNVLVLW